MLSKRAFAVVVGCAVVGTASATSSSSIDHIFPVGLGWFFNPCGHGNVSLDYDSGNFGTTIRVEICDFHPEVTYGVKVTSAGITADNFPLALTTDCGGDGVYEVFVPGDTTADPQVFIYMWDGNADLDAIEQITWKEIRAFGSGGCN